MLSPHLRALPKEISSYDILKTLAIIFMIVDHLGYYFFDNEVWFRLIGRFSVPIWFFLVGYASSDKIPFQIWLGAIIVAFSSLVSGQVLFPLNILFTIMIARHFRSRLILASLRTHETLWGMFLLLVLTTLPTSVFFEYGTGVFLIVILGVVARNPDIVPDKLKATHIKLFAVASILYYFLWEAIGHDGINYLQFTIYAAGAAATALMLYKFEPKTYPNLTKKLPSPLSGLIMLTGRYTLEFYVLHLLVFRAIAMALFPEKFAFWDWDIIPAEAAALFGV
ncbi:MAG: conjugal transfer protein TraX [Alphaproteobacteria bacterium]|nr:conjugal transfer protein TraX [Alphaproteobacteria bacterium]